MISRAFSGRPSFFTNGNTAHLIRSEEGRDAEHDAFAAVFELFLGVGGGEHGQEHAVKTDRGLDDVRHVVLVQFGIEVLEFLSGEFLVVAGVEVGAQWMPSSSLKPNGNSNSISRRRWRSGPAEVVVEAVLAVGKPRARCHFMRASFQKLYHSISVPGFDEVLHLHLLEFPHAEDELSGDDLVAETPCRSARCRRDLHPSGLLDVEEVHENTLGRFRAKVDGAGLFADGTELVENIRLN